MRFIRYQIHRLPQWGFYILALVVLFIFLSLILKKKANHWYQRLITLSAFLYLLFIIVVTLVNRQITVGKYGRFQIIPFWSYYEAIMNNHYLWYEIFLNYLLFVPFGVLYYQILKVNPFKRTLLIGIGVSITIEIIQFVFSIGLFELDDIIGNTLGCLLGILCGCFIKKFEN